jgi:GNAT superfamily N-acetyltransferase
MTKYRIRRAGPEDIVAIYGTMRRAFEEAPVKVPLIEPIPGMKWALRIMETGAIYVAEADGIVIGSIGIEVKTFPWTENAPLLNDTWFYVTPEYRRSRIASALLDKIRKHVHATKIPFFGGVNWGGDRVELKDRLIERHGFKYVGGNFTYGLEETDQ